MAAAVGRRAATRRRPRRGRSGMRVRQLSHAQHELDLFKGRDSWNRISAGRRLALAGHCGARLVLILLLMGRQVFSTLLGKKVS